MSLGFVMLDLGGTALLPEEAERLAHPAVGGVILFSRNYESPEQLQVLCREIHARRKPPLLIAVDQEGGRVQRFRDGFTRLPPLTWFGELRRQGPEKADRAAQRVGWLMASELRACGVDFSFGPVLDLGSGVSQVIGDRAFDARPAVVAELARAWIKGVHAAGMAVVAKHFPGHGSVAADSHLALPVDERRYEDIMMDDMLPFQRMIDYGIEAIMPAHVVYSQVDARPAGFSRFWLREVLRNRLGFQGAVFSDDLSMAAADAGGDYGERARAALDAGCDMVLVCNNPAAADQVLGALSGYDEPASHVRMLRMHGRAEVARARLHQDPVWQEAIHILAAFEEAPALSLDL
jgi:beta-N-acetylhexosaminidase